MLHMTLKMVAKYDDMAALTSMSDGDVCRFSDGSDRIFIYHRGRWIERVLLELEEDGSRLLAEVEKVLTGLQALSTVRIYNAQRLSDQTVVVNCKLIIPGYLAVKYPSSSVSVLLDDSAVPVTRRTVIWLFNDATGQVSHRYEERNLFQADDVVSYIESGTKLLSDSVNPTDIPWHSWTNPGYGLGFRTDRHLRSDEMVGKFRDMTERETN